MVERRPHDGSVVVWDGIDGVMLTPTSDGRVIVLTGRRTDHPFDGLLAVLGAEAIAELHTELGRLATKPTNERGKQCF
jgi:hypothetical protein